MGERNIWFSNSFILQLSELYNLRAIDMK